MREFDQRCLRQLRSVHVEVAHNHHEVGVSRVVHLVRENLSVDEVSDFFDLLKAADKRLSVEMKWHTELRRLSVRAEKMKACSVDVCQVNLGIEAAFLSHHSTLYGGCFEREEV